MNNNNVVLSVFFQKCLGIYLDERLAFDAHIEDLWKKFVLVLVFLGELNPLFLKSVFLNCINPWSKPYFDYCSPLWDTWDKTLKDNLQTLQNRAARIIYGANYDTRSKDILKNLQLDSLDLRRKKLKCVFLYQVLNGIPAPCLREDLERLTALSRGYDLRDSENWPKITQTSNKLPKTKL